LAKAQHRRTQELLDHGAFHCWNAPFGAKRISATTAPGAFANGATVGKQEEQFSSKSEVINSK